LSQITKKKKTDQKINTQKLYQSNPTLTKILLKYLQIYR